MAWVVALSFNGYVQYYRDFLLGQWRDMSPVGYGLLLVSIGVFGWLLMRSGTKGT
ncbi:MAG TPA: hypothetical protein VML55_23205 [Planctomycetaceae bacterium]|nr:hypothetical protein [Planctomycetaceae bacterium]